MLSVFQLRFKLVIGYILEKIRQDDIRLLKKILKIKLFNVQDTKIKKIIKNP